jgi:hypothetical protein
MPTTILDFVLEQKPQASYFLLGTAALVFVGCTVHHSEVIEVDRFPKASHVLRCLQQGGLELELWLAADHLQQHDMGVEVRRIPRHPTVVLYLQT